MEQVEEAVRVVVEVPVRVELSVSMVQVAEVAEVVEVAKVVRRVQVVLVVEEPLLFTILEQVQAR
jgi:hypothetical protein